MSDDAINELQAIRDDGKDRAHAQADELHRLRKIIDALGGEERAREIAVELMKPQIKRGNLGWYVCRGVGIYTEYLSAGLTWQACCSNGWHLTRDVARDTIARAESAARAARGEA